ncbi:MAG TPA: thermonuclease family protein [Sphingopyxis sp.]|nr:thermonuclease family protein [Sphingopyxis sp.]HMP45452.1 thermonuclease family protein [Sphingopyxis sp.]HMQ18741.1 thermonuclease family protein [Sphingopyxis sp.]
MTRRPSLSSRLRWRRRLRSFAALALLAAMALAVWLSLPAPVATLPLVEVIDGDSLRVRRDGAALTVRLAGLDAVEYRQDCAHADGRRWPCGREARAALEKLAGRGPLHCALQARDRYGRTLATCRTRPFPEGHDLGAEMVRQGWAVAAGDAYPVEDGEARAKRRGIWQGAFIPPADWRAAHTRPGGADGKADD